MSDHDNRDDGRTGAFLLGFIVGVLVCLTAGGAFIMVQQRRMVELARISQEEALLAREMAESARLAAEEQRRQAEAALEAAKKAKDKGKE